MRNGWMTRRSMLKGLALAGAMSPALISSRASAQLATSDGEAFADAQLLAAAKAEGKLTLYGAYPTDLMTPILREFETLTGIKPDYLRLVTQQLYNRVVAEHSANKLAADYVELTEPSMLDQLVKQGVLNFPHKVPAFGRLAPTVREAEGRWYLLARPVQALITNTELVAAKDEPKKWTDLLDPKWGKGQIGLVSIDVGGSMFISYAQVRKLYGIEFWHKLAAQKPRIYPTVPAKLLDLARGEVSLGLSGPLQATVMAKGGSPLKVLFPSDGTAAFGIWGGIPATAPHPNAAKLYLNWMTTKRASNLMAQSGAYGIHPEAQAPDAGGLKYPPADQVWTLPLDEWIAVRDTYSAEWRKIFGVN